VKVVAELALADVVEADPEPDVAEAVENAASVVLVEEEGVVELPAALRRVAARTVGLA